MADTTLYLSREGSTIKISSTIGWDIVPAAHVDWRLKPAKDLNGFLELSFGDGAHTFQWDYLLNQAVSPPLEGAQTIGGASWTVTGRIRGKESDAAADHRVQLTLRVVSRDGTTSRGTLYTGPNSGGSPGAEELDIVYENRQLPFDGPAALSEVVCQDGDRIVAEVGIRSMNTVTTSYTGFLDIGADSSVSDLPEDETTTTQLAAWIKITGPNAITFETETLEALVDYNPHVWHDGNEVFSLADQYSVVSYPTVPGLAKAAKRTVRPGDQFGATSGERSLGKWTSSDENRLEGSTRHYLYAFMLRPDNVLPSNWLALVEWHGGSGSAQAPLKVDATDGFGNSILNLIFNTGEETATPTWEYDQRHTLLSTTPHGAFVLVLFSILWDRDTGGEVLAKLKVANSPWIKVLELRGVPTLQFESGILTDVHTLAGLYRNDPNEKVVTANAATDEFTATAHGFVVDQVVRFTTTGTLPAGLSLNTDYYIVTVPTADTFEVSATEGGAPVDITDAGTGTHTATHYITTIGWDGPFMRATSEQALLDATVAVTEGFWSDDPTRNAGDWTMHDPKVPPVQPSYIASLGRRPVPMIQGPDSDQIMRLNPAA